MGSTHVTDTQAMAALAKGEISALDELVIRHNERAQRLAFGVLRERSLTHDVVADAFLAVVAAAKKFDGARPFSPWFDRIVVNRAIKEAQRTRRHERINALLGRNQTSEDPADLAALGELRKLLLGAFMQLSPKDRAVVSMRLVLGYSEDETADVLGCPVGTVKSRLSRARKQLQAQLIDAGISGSDYANLEQPLVAGEKP
jgi:RNA polymerase sigma-70 factor (ECF subfamily)